MRKKRVKDTSSSNDEYSNDENESIDDLNRAVVECIIDEQETNGHKFYRVKWATGPNEPEAITWEPEENLDNCPEILKNWTIKKKPVEPKKKAGSRKKQSSSSDSDDGDFYLSSDDDFKEKKKKKYIKKSSIPKHLETRGRKKTKITTNAEQLIESLSTPLEKSSPSFFLPARKAVLPNIKEEMVDVTNLFDSFVVNLDESSSAPRDSLVGLQTTTVNDPVLAINNDLFDPHKTDNRKSSITFIESVFPEECDVGTVSFTNLVRDNTICTLPTDLVASCYNHSLSNYYETRFLDSSFLDFGNSV